MTKLPRNNTTHYYIQFKGYQTSKHISSIRSIILFDALYGLVLTEVMDGNAFISLQKVDIIQDLHKTWRHIWLD